MIRNPNPFTERQNRLLDAIRKKICEINDPQPEIITHESYEWVIKQTKQFGKIPKIRFYPNSCITKAELIKDAGLINESKHQKIVELRKKIRIETPRDKENRIMARLFESEWNSIMFKAKKATFIVALINQLFCSMDQIISEPIKFLQNIVMEEYSPQIKAKTADIHTKEMGKSRKEKYGNHNSKPYDEELGEI